MNRNNFFLHLFIYTHFIVLGIRSVYNLGWRFKISLNKSFLNFTGNLIQEDILIIKIKSRLKVNKLLWKSHFVAPHG
jgi:hypothetical protein